MAEKSRISGSMMLRVAAMTVALSAANTYAAVWDGNGNSNASGDWDAGGATPGQNWDTDSLPVTADTVTLPSVTAGGTRTITQNISGGTTIDTLIMEQSDPLYTNKLSLSGDLSLNKLNSASGSGSAFKVNLSGGATAANAQVDLNGNSIVILSPANNTGAGTNLDATFNFNATGSKIRTTTAHTGHFSLSIGGVVNVTEDGSIERSSSSGTGNASFTFGSASSLNLAADKTFSFLVGNVSGSGRSNSVTNNGLFDVQSGATLSIRVASTSATGTDGNARLTIGSTGSISQAGAIELKDRATTGALQQFINNGVWTISGTSATVKALNSSSTVFHVPTFDNNATGVLRGSGASNTLEFNEDNTGDTPRMTITNNGTIAPGAGSAGSLLTSVGTLRLRDINVTSGTTGKMVIDLGGASTGEFDRLLLETGATDPAGAGTLDLAATGDTLQLNLVNSFAPNAAFNLNLITAGAVNGEFDTVKLDASTFTANTLVNPEGTYTLSYTPTAVNLSFTPVPEPVSISLLGAAGVGLLARRRRPN